MNPTTQALFELSVFSFLFVIGGLAYFAWQGRRLDRKHGRPPHDSSPR